MKRPDHTEQLLQLCRKPQRQRSQQEVFFIRDRLHECSRFFRLWPSQLQQLLARLLQARQWAQHEVVAAAGDRPRELCFVIAGQAAVAVREAPGSSMLKHVALLHAGDTFGELCLLGRAKQHPAFVVARSQLLDVLTVSADALAEAMRAGIVATTAPTTSTSSAASVAVSTQQQQQQQQQQDATMSGDALYKLIGESRGPPNAALSPQQAAAVRQLHSRQLQEAAEAEAATVGAWQQLPHQRLSEAAAVAAAPQGDAAEPPLPEQPGLKAWATACCVERGAGQPEGPDAAPACAAGAAAAASDGEQQQSCCRSSPLMRHAAIMHFAALKASAAGAGAGHPNTTASGSSTAG